VTASGNIVASVTHAKANAKSSGHTSSPKTGLPLSGITYFHQNFVNTTNMTTNAAGALNTQYYYKPFGEMYATSGQPTTPYTFGSKELDETGLYYFSSRYYDPVTTRFISADNQPGGSIYQSDALNRYAYTLNDPIKYYDPSGHELGFLEIGIVLGIEAVGAVVTDGAALPEEVALDASMAKAGEEVGADFLNALRETRASGQVSDEQCISIYKAKRSALSTGSQYDIHPSGLGTEDSERIIGRDVHGNEVFNNVGSADEVSLQQEIGKAANYKIPAYRDFFPNTDDLQTIGQSMERTKGIGGFKFALSFDDYSLRISHNYLDDFVKHSLLTGEGREGRDVFTAGTVDIENGNLIIRNWSGHYHPSKESIRMADPIWRMMRNSGYLNFNGIIYQ
jgi:RHS repeat-associated protein